MVNLAALFGGYAPGHRAEFQVLQKKAGLVIALIPPILGAAYSTISRQPELSRQKLETFLESVEAAVQ